MIIAERLVIIDCIQGIINGLLYFSVARRGAGFGALGGAHLADERGGAERRQGARRSQMARAWPRAAQRHSKNQYKNLT